MWNFYRNPLAQAMFENYATTIVQRRNTYSGIAYRWIEGVDGSRTSM